MKKVTLSEKELKTVLPRFTPETQASRIILWLSRKHSQSTVILNSNCATGNISDVVSKCINPRIFDLGLMVACEKPPLPYPNRFRQPTQMHSWSLYQVPAFISELEPANDPKFDR